MSKESMEYVGKEVNNSRVGPFRVVRNALQKTTSSYEYKAMWVTYNLRCSSGSMYPKYHSSVKGSHWLQRGVVVMTSTKGWRRLGRCTGIGC